MISITGLHKYAVRPALRQLRIKNAGLEALLIGAAVVRSDARRMDRMADLYKEPGPFYGLWMMGEAEHDKLLFGPYPFLHIDRAADNLASPDLSPAENMAANLPFAAALAALKVLASAFPLDKIPEPRDARGLAEAYCAVWPTGDEYPACGQANFTLKYLDFVDPRIFEAVNLTA